MFWGQQAGSALGTHGVNEMSWSLRRGRWRPSLVSQMSLSVCGWEFLYAQTLDSFHVQRTFPGLGVKEAGSESAQLGYGCCRAPCSTPPIDLLQIWIGVGCVWTLTRTGGLG